MTHRSSGIVLAGGRSERMGTPKALLDLGGHPLLTHVARALHGSCDEILLSVAAGPDARPDLVERLRDAVTDAGWPQPVLIRDRRRDSGPVAGLAAALGAARGVHAFVAACDTPFLAPTLVEGLLRRARRSGEPDVVLPVHDGHEQPLLAVYRVATMAPHFVRCLEEGRRRPTDGLERHRVVRVEAADLVRLDPSGESFVNLNDPEAYRRARERFLLRGRGAPSG